MIFSLYSFTGSAQFIDQKLTFGGNYSSISAKDERLSSALRPFIGFSTGYLLTDRWVMEGMINYSYKASHLTSTADIEQRGIDFLLAPTYIKDDFIFKGGISIENFSESSIRSRGNQRLSPLEKPEVNKFQLNYFMGVECKLSNTMNLFVHRIIPSSSQNTTSLMLGFKYNLSKGRTKSSSYRKIRRMASERHIKELKEGVLLVRLKTLAPTIAAMEKMNFHKKAEKVRVRQKRLNQELMTAFKKNYRFSDVLFFFSHSSGKVRAKEYTNIFLNDSLEVDPTITLNKKTKVFTAEFTQIEQDSLLAYAGTEFISTGSFQNVTVDRYYGSPNMGFKAIVIKTYDFKQLTEPFPYYSRQIRESVNIHPEVMLFIPPIAYAFIPISFDYCVQKLDRRLTRFYSRSIE